MASASGEGFQNWEGVNDYPYSCRFLALNTAKGEFKGTTRYRYIIGTCPFNGTSRAESPDLCPVQEPKP
jgi:hypothetical protein